MVSGRDNVHAKTEQGLRILFGNSFPIGDVLAVDDAEIHLILLKICLQEFFNELQTGFAHNIADKKDVQEI